MGKELCLLQALRGSEHSLIRNYNPGIGNPIVRELVGQVVSIDNNGVLYGINNLRILDKVI